jgi:hypothetical protein
MSLNLSWSPVPATRKSVQHLLFYLLLYDSLVIMLTNYILIFYTHHSENIRMMHTTNDSVIMATTKNMEHILAPNPDAAMDVFSFMRPIADENIKNLYSNLQSSSMYMSKTQQMAKIIPSPVSVLLFFLF